MYEKGKRVVRNIKHKDTWFHRLDHRYKVSGWAMAFATCLLSMIILDYAIGRFTPFLIDAAIHTAGCISVFYVYDKKGWIKT